MGKYTKYSNHGGNHHLRTDMDHERRLIDDAKDAIYNEDKDLRDRKSAGHQDGKDLEVEDPETIYNPISATASVKDNEREDKESDL